MRNANRLSEKYAPPNRATAVTDAMLGGFFCNLDSVSELYSENDLWQLAFSKKLHAAVRMELVTRTWHSRRHKERHTNSIVPGSKPGPRFATPESSRDRLPGRREK
jgi:hypothetical protein